MKKYGPLISFLAAAVCFAAAISLVFVYKQQTAELTEEFKGKVQNWKYHRIAEAEAQDFEDL